MFVESAGRAWRYSLFVLGSVWCLWYCILRVGSSNPTGGDIIVFIRAGDEDDFACFAWKLREKGSGMHQSILVPGEVWRLGSECVMTVYVDARGYIVHMLGASWR